MNQYIATLIVRKTVKGSYLYEINIKKKRVRRLSHEDRTVENRFLVIILAQSDALCQ